MNTRSKKYFPVKPARSYEEQLTRLSEIHDLTIGDPIGRGTSFLPSIITA